MWPRLTARGGGESWTFSARFPDRAPLGAVVVVASVRPPVGGPAAAGDAGRSVKRFGTR